MYGNLWRGDQYYDFWPAITDEQSSENYSTVMFGKLIIVFLKLDTSRSVSLSGYTSLPLVLEAAFQSPH